MANRFQRIDGTAPIVDAAENTPPRVPKSVLPYEATKYGTAIVGALTPVDVMTTKPGEQFDINYNAVIELSNPMVRKCFNGFTIYFHTYYNRWSDLWEGAQNFIDRGRTGKITGTMPNAVAGIKVTTANRTDTYYMTTAGSLYDYLGVPPTHYNIDSPLEGFDTASKQYEGTLYKKTGESTTRFINALLPFMYQRIWRDKYAPQNLLQDNKNIFPENEDHFILPYNATNVATINYDKQAFIDGATPNDQNIIESTEQEAMNDLGNTDRYRMSSADNEKQFWLDCLRFRQYKGDYYTTASPFPNLIRGDTPILGDLATRTTNNATAPIVTTPNYRGPLTLGTTTDDTNYMVTTPSGSGATTGAPMYALIQTAVKQNILNTIEFNAIRALEAYTIFAERMARTSGQYNEMIYAQFGYNPHSPTREAQYIGGFKQEILFNTITQTSESGETPLGTQTTQGIGSGGTQYRRFTAPDYGYIITLMSIMPDTIYTNGQEYEVSIQNQSDVYFPIFNNLGPEAIKNKELFVSGNPTTDEDVFGYAERNHNDKARVNRAYGLLRLDHTQMDEYASRIQARRWKATPTLNNQFTTIDTRNYDNQIFTSYTEPQFTYAIQSNVKKRSPMPYTTEPAGLMPSAV